MIIYQTALCSRCGEVNTVPVQIETLIDQLFIATLVEELERLIEDTLLSASISPDMQERIKLLAAKVKRQLTTPT